MCGVIYCITCLLTQMKYVGQTTRDLKIRIAEHKYHGELYIDQEIQRLGWENFVVEVLEECETLEKLDEREKARTPKARSESARKREANRSPEERSATARARELAKPFEVRSARAKACAARRTPEERSAITKKAWVTRRANEAKKTPEEKAATAKSPEELSAIAKKAAAKVDKKARNAKVSKTWKLKIPDEIATIVAKRMVTRQKNKRQRLIRRLIECLKNFL